MFEHSSLKETVKYAGDLINRVKPILSESIQTSLGINRVAQYVYFIQAIFLLFLTAFIADIAMRGLKSIPELSVIFMILAGVTFAFMLLLFYSSYDAHTKVRQNNRALALRARYPDARYHMIELTKLQTVLNQGIKGNRVINVQHILDETPQSELEEAEAHRLHLYASAMVVHIRALDEWADTHQEELESVA